eukprot:2704426-Rhodomonas_salina.4
MLQWQRKRNLRDEFRTEVVQDRFEVCVVKVAAPRQHFSHMPDERSRHIGAVVDPTHLDHLAVPKGTGVLDFARGLSFFRHQLPVHIQAHDTPALSCCHRLCAVLRRHLGERGHPHFVVDVGGSVMRCKRHRVWLRVLPRISPACQDPTELIVSIIEPLAQDRAVPRQRYHSSNHGHVPGRGKNSFCVFRFQRLLQRPVVEANGGLVRPKAIRIKDRPEIHMKLGQAQPTAAAVSP